jgi:hypothetical protein
MANGISYTGRLINNRGQCEFGQSRAGNPVLKVVIAEQHQGRNDRVAAKYQDKNQAADAYVDTTTSWHRVAIFGDQALELAEDPGFNHGALIEVTNAQYIEEDPWKTKDNVERAGRPETIGRDSYIGILERNGKRYEARDDNYGAIHEPGDPIPTLKGSGGGGGGGGKEYSDEEGF